MWGKGEVFIAIALGAGGAYVTLYPPQSSQSYWFAGFIVFTLVAGFCAFMAAREASEEDAQKHSELLTATTGGENFAYIYPVGPGNPDEPIEKQPAIIRPWKNSPIYNLNWALWNDAGELVASGQADALNGASHLGVSPDLAIGNYTAWISARNGEIHETIVVTAANGGKHASFKVERGINPHNLPHATLLEGSR